MDTEGEVVTSAAGSVLVGADGAEIDVVGALRASAADVLSEIHDTATVAAGDVMSVTSAQLDVNAFGSTAASMTELLVGR